MAEVLVLASAATRLYLPSGDRESITVQNLGPNPIYLDYDPAVTSATGIKLPTDAIYDVAGGRKGLYARAGVADQIAGTGTRIIVETN